MHNRGNGEDDGFSALRPWESNSEAVPAHLRTHALKVENSNIPF